MVFTANAMNSRAHSCRTCGHSRKFYEVQYAMRPFVLPVILFLVATAVHGQGYPHGPLRMVMPSAADSTPDIQAQTNSALNSPAFAEKVVPAGITLTGGTPEQFAEHIRRETEKWGAVTKAAGMRAD